jgi:hypothetical protein
MYKIKTAFDTYQKLFFVHRKLYLFIHTLSI